MRAWACFGNFDHCGYEIVIIKIMLTQLDPTWHKKNVYSSLHTCYLSQDILSNEDTTSLLEGLEPDTLYDVSITAIYPDESESEDLMGSQRTCKQPQNPPFTLFE